MVGFTLLSRSYYYLRRRSPGPPFPPDHRQAGERGAIRLIQNLDHCMPFWQVLEWLQESFLTRGTIMYSWIAQKRSLGFLVKNASDTSKRQKIPMRGLQVPLWGHL
jgi:hypothetical protein